MTEDAKEKTKRICQVSLEDEEYEDIKHIASRRNMTAEQWIEATVSEARVDYHRRVERIRRVIEETSHLNFPTADIEDMLKEIESGYLDNGYLEE